MKLCSLVWTSPCSGGLDRELSRKMDIGKSRWLWTLPVSLVHVSLPSDHSACSMQCFQVTSLPWVVTRAFHASTARSCFSLTLQLELMPGYRHGQAFTFCFSITTVVSATSILVLKASGKVFWGVYYQVLSKKAEVTQLPSLRFEMG